jgi:hypothetical protein
VRLPNAEYAVVDLQKLTDYVLNPTHPTGRHKARVFFSVLGLTQADASFLRETILRAVLTREATPEAATEYGERYVVDFEMMNEHGTATVRSAWMIRLGENFPRLTSCYVL